MRGIFLDGVCNQGSVLAEGAMLLAGWRVRVMRVPLATCRLARRLLKRSREQASGRRASRAHREYRKHGKNRKQSREKQAHAGLTLELLGGKVNFHVISTTSTPRKKC
jgi:hypothetical protein